MGASQESSPTSSADQPDEHDQEPADPQPVVCTSSERQDRLLAPQSADFADIPDALIENGKPLTVGEAMKTYVKIVRSNWNSEKYTSKYERHLNLYRRILHADRCVQQQFSDVTTVLFTRRLSPLKDEGEWLTPWKCNEMLHGDSVQRSIRESLSYSLDPFDWEWIGVTAPTEGAGTPHEHLYLWIDDPDDAITTDHIEPALEKHLKHCAHAYENDHQYQQDGSDGAITIKHTPPIDPEWRKKVAKQIIREETAPKPNTAGAIYLASQLAHLSVSDYYSSEQDAPDQLLEGAALAWASPYNWFRASQKVSSLGRKDETG